MRKLFPVRAVYIGLGTTFLAGWLSAPPAVAAATPGSDRAVMTAVQAPGQGRPGTPTTHGWEWWNDAEVQKELALSAEKIERISNFYSRRNADLRPILNEFIKQSEELEKMTRARVVDENTYSLQVLRVEAVRQRLNESRTMLLYRIYRELTPEQYVKLQDILDRRYRGGNRGRTPDAR